MKILETLKTVSHRLHLIAYDVITLPSLSSSAESISHYQLDLTNLIYLNTLIGVLTSITTLIMLLVAMNGPRIVLKLIDTPRFTFLFTFRGRYLLDLYVSLYLYAMDILGILMATVTLGMIFGIRFAGVRHPEAFPILFRQTASEYDDEGTVYTDAGDTYDGTYDRTYDGATLESAPPCRLSQVHYYD